MINTAMSYLSSAAVWVHQTIREIPVAGPFYNSFNENISSPLWEQGNRVATIAAPYFNPIRDKVVEKAKEYPTVATALCLTPLFFLVRAVYLKYNPPGTN